MIHWWSVASVNMMLSGSSGKMGKLGHPVIVLCVGGTSRQRPVQYSSLNMVVVPYIMLEFTGLALMHDTLIEKYQWKRHWYAYDLLNNSGTCRCFHQNNVSGFPIVLL